MGKLGFLLLFIGGILLTYFGLDLSITVVMADTIRNFMIELLTPHVGGIMAGQVGQFIYEFLRWATTLGGLGVILGSLVWFGFGYGSSAAIGRRIVSLSTWSLSIIILAELSAAWGAGVFTRPLFEIFLYFLGLGWGFGSIAIIWIGRKVGAGRDEPPPEVEKKVKVKVELDWKDEEEEVEVEDVEVEVE